MKNIGNGPIAVRELHLHGDMSRVYKVEVYSPKKTANGTYVCRICIEGAPEGLNQLDIGGVDSYAALLSALQAIPTMVDIYNKQYMNMMLRWLPEDEDLHFGLDLLKSSTD